MKKILTVIALASVATLSYAQGIINWQNSSATLISAGGTATPNVAGQYIYAVFLAPSTAAAGDGQASSGGLDPLFQVAAAYNTNAAAAGRLNTRSGVDVGGSPGGTVDFIIRGWSVNAGRTWAEALLFWNNGQPAQDMYLGSSLIANNFVLGGGAIPVNGIMGTLPNTAQGFNMIFFPAIPEPSSMALAGLGAASLLMFRRRK